MFYEVAIENLSNISDAEKWEINSFPEEGVELHIISHMASWVRPGPYTLTMPAQGSMS